MVIQLIKLVNGEELLSQVNHDRGKITLIDPLLVVERFDVDKGSKYWGLARYIQYSKDNNLELERSSIIYMTDAMDLIATYYIRQLEALKLQDSTYDKFSHIKQAIDLLDDIIDGLENGDNGPTDKELEDIEKEEIVETPKKKYLH